MPSWACWKYRSRRGDLGPVIVLAGDADGSPATELDEALTAQVSTGASHLAIDVTNLRSLDPGNGADPDDGRPDRHGRGGRTVLVSPQEPVLKMLSRTRTAEMFTIQAPDTGRDRPDASAASGGEETRASD